MLRRTFATVLLTVPLLATALLAGCAAPKSEEELRLDRTFHFVRRQIIDIGRDPIAAASYQNLLQMGASPLDYVAAALPDDADFANMVWAGPPAAWTVVLREGPGPDDFVIDAYGADASKPVRSETITVRALPPP
jgi:hypothetical protein